MYSNNVKPFNAEIDFAFLCNSSSSSMFILPIVKKSEVAIALLGVQEKSGHSEQKHELLQPLIYLYFLIILVN